MITVIINGITITFKAFLGCGLFIQALLGVGHFTITPPTKVTVICPAWGCGGYPYPLHKLPIYQGVCPAWGCNGYPYPLRKLNES